MKQKTLFFVCALLLAFGFVTVAYLVIKHNKNKSEKQKHLDNHTKTMNVGTDQTGTPPQERLAEDKRDDGLNQIDREKKRIPHGKDEQKAFKAPVSSKDIPSEKTKVHQIEENEVSIKPNRKDEKEGANLPDTPSSSENDSSQTTDFLEHPDFIQLSSCSLDNNTSFCEAHLKFYKTLTKIFKKNLVISGEDTKALNESFSRAKALFNSSITDSLMTKIYQAPDGIMAATRMFIVNGPFILPELQALVPFEKNRSLMIAYNSLYRLSLLGKSVLPSTCNLTFKNYKSERYSFINCLYSKLFSKSFNDVLASHIRSALEASNLDRLQEIIEWWKSFQFQPSERKYDSISENYKAVDVKDIASAGKFAMGAYLNQNIDRWISGDADKKAEASEHYARTQMPLLFDLPPTLPEAVAQYFTPYPKALAVDQAVLNTQPRKLAFKRYCFASSYFQSMANFLPLFMKCPGWTSVSSDPIFAEYKGIIEKVAQTDATSFEVSEQMSWPPKKVESFGPFDLHVRFLSDVAYSGLALNQVLGMAWTEPSARFYFPPYMVYEVKEGMPELSNVTMIGQLFVTSLIGPHDALGTKNALFYEPFELPLEIDLRVVGTDQPKRFELYSFIMGQHMNIPHVVSYVKRAHGQWWLCDDLGSNSMVSSDSLPNTATKQRALTTLKQRPIMAFYLRTEQ